MAAISFNITHRSSECNARTGSVTTPHGSFETPAFMPVGTKATVKGLLPENVRAVGSEIILANTYHLMLRPGSELIARRGGLQPFTNWRGPMLTDSGGFQVFSLTDINAIDEDGVTFKSHLDGSAQRLTPERSMQVQNELGADIIMAFDDCPPPPPPEVETGERVTGKVRHSTDDYPKRNRDAADRTARWLDRCTKAHARPDEQALFGIVQGGDRFGSA
jgi:queuine tRNA-ribosyltransferase